MINTHFLHKSRLGTLLLKRQLITHAQLRDAVRDQSAHPELPLGQLLIEKNLITRKQLRRTLHWQYSLRCATVAVAFTLLPLQVVNATTYRASTGNELLGKWNLVLNLLEKAKNMTLQGSSLSFTFNDDHLGEKPEMVHGSRIFLPRNATPYGNVMNLFRANHTEQLTNSVDYIIKFKPDGAVLNMHWQY